MGNSATGELFVKATLDRTPSWLSLFEGALNLDAADLHNASSAAVLIVTASEKTFALTFGYGRSLLRPGIWEEDFGLRVTLNAVDPLRIRSVDRFKFDAISQHSQIQSSRDANIVEFGLDVEQDLLRAVTGKPRDPSLANQLTGKDALKADVRISLAGIPELLSRFWNLFGETTYRESFQWVDKVNEVRDLTQLDTLNAVLIERLTTRNFDRLWLGIPDRVEWEGMAGFRYRAGHHAQIHPDVHFRTFFEDAGEDYVPTIESLKNRKRVYLFNFENDFAVGNWPLYKCIYCEIESPNETFLLNNGKWYRVRSDFLETVDNSFREVLRDSPQLPNYMHADEEDYNEAVAASAPAEFCLMDQKFIRHPTGRDEVEFCDLFSRSRQVIHVKRYRGSATLSHLFSQGVVSGELFCSLREFREGVDAYLQEPFRIADVGRRPNNDEYEVVFAIVSKSLNPLTLPFFSRVNLRNAAQRLKAFGYRVSVIKVQAVERVA
jgi:uncharacterized protein (TIGR04141 family)